MRISELDLYIQIVIRMPSNPFTMFLLDSIHTMIPIYLDKIPINNEITTFLVVLSLATGLIYIGSKSVTHPFHPPKSIMNYNDILTHLMNYQSMGIWSTLLIPVMASASLLSLYYLIDFNNVLKYFNNYILFTSLFTNYNSFYFLLQSFLPGLNFDKMFQFSFTVNREYKGPTGYLESIDFDKLSELPISDPKPKTDSNSLTQDVDDKIEGLNFKYYLLANKFKIIRPKAIIPDHSIMLNTNSLISFVFAIALSTSTYYYQSSYILSNLTALNFTLFSLTSTNLIKKVSHGSLLLVLLFFYDIYFVFGSKVMITVAQNVDFPIKLLIPKLITTESGSSIGFSLLGLGDIVIPGSFIMLITRFKPQYLYLELVLYSFGLIESFLAVFMLSSGQPALLYIVPNLLIGTVLYSSYKGELKDLWKFSIELDSYDNDIDYKQHLKSIPTNLIALDSDLGGSELEELDDDYDLDSYDEWEFKVEDLRDHYDQELLTDKDLEDEENEDGVEQYPIQQETIYNFIDDDDDQTFIIEQGESEEEDEDNEGDIDEDDEISDNEEEEIDILIKDSKTTPSYWYE